jgi:hypothetical protein
MHNDTETGKPVPPKMWAFTRQRGWHKVPDPFPDAGTRDESGDWLRGLGFVCSGSYGTEGDGLSLDLFEDIDAGAPFVAQVKRCLGCTPVYVPELPDLLQLLRELLPLVRADLAVQEAATKHKERHSRRRRCG